MTCNTSHTPSTSFLPAVPPESSKIWHSLISLVPPLPSQQRVKTESIFRSLKISPDARAAMEEHANLIGVDCRWFTNNPADQDTALEFLISLQMHIPEEIARNARSKLVIRTSDHNSVKCKKDKKKQFERWHRLYQCQCGSDNEEGHRAGKRRDIPWKNVGCGFWVKLTTTHAADSDNSMILTIDEISGDFTHSAECLDQTEMDINPRVPLNHDLRDYALSLLRLRVPLSQLKQLCRTWAENRWGSSPGDDYSRFVITNYETTSLYRTLARECGIPQAPPQDNLDLWFRKSNPQPPDPRLPASCLAYTPHLLGESERFSLVLATSEQKILAWKYGHKCQVLTDLTFGICSGRVLLAILMAIDDNNHGIPIGMLLFSARQEAKAVHADYNGPLLERLLGEWKKEMGKNADGEDFDIAVGNTDNDPRERHALQQNWALIILLLCMFHTWQAWRNALIKHLRGIPKGNDREEDKSRIILTSVVRRHIGKFLMRLLKEIEVFEDAVAAYNVEIRYFKNLLGRNRTDLEKQQGRAGLAFLGYLQSYLKLRDFWLSWSLAGARAAAVRMGVPITKVARTTNHLESFNGRLKGKYFAHHMRSGRLPRLDSWVLVLLTEALPDFFAEWAEKRALTSYYSQMRNAVPQSLPPHAQFQSRQPSNPMSTSDPILPTLPPSDS
ncbi:hypothetical protein FB451DRAFT_1043328, partial [Mycena latifolia]